MMTMCWMGEPFIGETVLAATGEEGVKIKDDWQPAIHARQTATAATEPSPAPTPNLAPSRLLPFALPNVKGKANAERKLILFTNPWG